MLNKFFFAVEYSGKQQQLEKKKRRAKKMEEDEEEEATSSGEEIETENFESAAKEAIQSMSIDKQVQPLGWDSSSSSSIESYSSWFF